LAAATTSLQNHGKHVSTSSFPGALENLLQVFWLLFPLTLLSASGGVASMQS